MTYGKFLINNAGLHILSPQIKGLDARISAISPSHKNPWLIVFEAEKKKTPRKVDMRTTAITHYDGDEAALLRGNKRGLIATCSVTGCRGFDREVDAAHILPLGSPEYWERSFEITNLNNLRNIVLLCKNIETAFDRLQLCFLQHNEKPGEYKLKIWDKKGLTAKTLFDYYRREKDNTVSLENGEVCDDQGGQSQKLITAYDGHVFRFPEGKHPFSKILSYHAQESFKWALEQNWITCNEECPQEYGSPLDDDMLVCHNSVDPLRRGDTSTTSETSLSARQQLFSRTPSMAAQQTTTTPWERTY